MTGDASSVVLFGNPKKVIKRAHKKGIKVFCDVTDLHYAQKVESLGADGVIAVNNEAGGHRGDIDPKTLIETLKSNLKIPVISAGGVKTVMNPVTVTASQPMPWLRLMP